jgi:hypothetical protein
LISFSIVLLCGVYLLQLGDLRKTLVPIAGRLRSGRLSSAVVVLSMQLRHLRPQLHLHRYLLLHVAVLLPHQQLLQLLLLEICSCCGRI